MNTLEISIIMSVWNEEQFVSRAIESILSQTERNFVFMIFNDGSTDNTGSVIKTYKDPRIVYFDSPKQHGLTKRLNELLAKVTTKYTARMDADDVSDPERLKKQKLFMDEHIAAAAIGSNFVRYCNGKKIHESNFPLDPEKIKSSILLKNTFKHSALFFLTDILKNTGGYNDKFKYAQDYELMLRLASRYPVYNLAEPLITDRYLYKAISQQHRLEQGWYMLRAQFIALQKYNYPFWQSIYLIRSLAFLVKSALIPL